MRTESRTRDRNKIPLLIVYRAAVSGMISLHRGTEAAGVPARRNSVGASRMNTGLEFRPSAYLPPLRQFIFRPCIPTPGSLLGRPLFGSARTGAVPDEAARHRALRLSSP